MIYKYALDRIPKHQAQELFKYYTMFEKKFGDRRGIEDVIVSKRRFQYEEEVKVTPAETIKTHSLSLIHMNISILYFIYHVVLNTSKLGGTDSFMFTLPCQKITSLIFF